MTVKQLLFVMIIGCFLTLNGLLYFENNKMGIIVFLIFAFGWAIIARFIKKD
ncbi:hypothetical protein JOD45_000175 [Scopulibacillus daqui]|uniref:Uncharacterized protein n=1 Tax=Scopulibacillus daqui TaxID=1469162 RepID=A0ABS2PWY9_9BACL|nr:hypothetical protein [Scopulibacillus daqui]